MIPPSQPSSPSPSESPDYMAQREDFDQLFAQWRKSGDPNLREQLILMHVSLVRFLARRFADRGESIEDLEQQGIIGLIRALDNYNLSHGVRFATFATPAIIGELRHYLRDKSRSVRVPRQIQEMGRDIAAKIESLHHQLGRSPNYREIATAMNISVEEVIQCVEAARSRDAISLDEPRSEEGQESLIGQMAEKTPALRMDDIAALRIALDQLPRRERRALEYVYFQGLSQSETAHAMHVSQMHISRLLKKGLATLRHRLAEWPPRGTDDD